MAAITAIDRIMALDTAEPLSPDPARPDDTQAEEVLGAKSAFAGRLRALRKRRELSQTELGQRAGLHYTHIGRFERGASRPSGDTLKRLADALDVTSDYLLDGAQDEAARSRLADRELLQQFQAVEQLPEHDKHVVKTLLDAFLTKKQLQKMIG